MVRIAITTLFPRSQLDGALVSEGSLLSLLLLFNVYARINLRHRVDGVVYLVPS
jgi:hypothetical protein